MKISLKLLTLLMLAILVLTGCSQKSEAPKIGLSWSTDEAHEDSKDKVDEDTQVFADALRKAGAEVVFLNEIKSLEQAKEEIANVSGVIVTGGADLNPALYNEEPIETLEEIDERRDSSDVFLVKALLEEDKPTIATCRGMQLTNILSGGTLYQDIIVQNPTNIVHRDPNLEVYVKHNITVDKDNLLSNSMGKDGVIEVNSWHHQTIKDLGDNLKVIAKADDGTIEAIERTDKTYFLGIQYHPEDQIVSDNDENALNLYKSFIAKAEEISKNK